MERFELLPDEKIVISNPIHWKNYILPGAGIVLCLAAIAMRLRYDGTPVLALAGLDGSPVAQKLNTIAVWTEALALVCAVAVLAYRIVKTAYTQYYVTTKRIIISRGLLDVNIVEMTLEKCETVNLYQKLYERFFNSGDILCISAGTSIYLDDVYDARRFKQTIVNMITNLKTNNNNEDNQ